MDTEVPVGGYSYGLIEPTTSIRTITEDTVLAPRSWTVENRTDSARKYANPPLRFDFSMDQSGIQDLISTGIKLQVGQNATVMLKQ